MNPITGQDVVAEARRWIGTPWRHQARLRGIGVDCGGLVIGVGQALGLPVQDHPPGYARLPDGVSLRACVEGQCTRIPELEQGAILLLRWEADPQHLAIVSMLPEGFIGMIHAWAGIRRVVEHGLTPEWQARIVHDEAGPAIYRLPGVA
jgi:NlpC/P60 family putative phage cell wall peptidase